MIPWTLVAISIGLWASLGAFGIAFFNLRQKVSDFVIFEPLNNGLRWMGIATLLLFVTLVGAGVSVYSKSHDSEKALCALRGDLEVRVAASDKYLTEHPDALKKFGVTKAQLKESTDNQERTIEILGILDC